MRGIVSVVVPVRNEAENIVPLVEEIYACLQGKADFEVLYVDDGSTNATPQRLVEACARFPRLRLIRHRQSAARVPHWPPRCVPRATYGSPRSTTIARTTRPTSRRCWRPSARAAAAPASRW
jgi:cellulose synthase/poly-beta-1,6-N-acetylglucosamine synthase-like glycosyltransferase